MKKELVQALTDNFEGHAQQTETGVEYWLARDIQHLLGYTEWRNFGLVINKAQTACELSNHSPLDHFVDVNKTIAMPKGASKDVPDIMLTRYACYLIAQNGDPRKPEIAFAQTYFAVQTRKAELIEQRMLDAERIHARKKLTETEKELSQVIYEQTGGNQDFALIRSKGDHALFGKSTQAMKAQWKVPESRPLADFAPTILFRPKTSPRKSPSSTPAIIRWTVKGKFPKSTSPTTKRCATPCWIGGFAPKACHRKRMSKGLNGACSLKTKKH